MSREVHVRICEGVGVRFPHVTRPLYPSIFFFHPKFYCYLAHFHAKGDLSTWLFAFPLALHYRAVLARGSS